MKTDTVDRKIYFLSSGLSPARMLLAAVICLVPVSAVSANGLFDIYQQAKVYDADLKAAEYDFEALKQLVPLSRSALRPQASLSGDIAFNDVNPDGSDNYTSQVLNLTLRQTLYNRSNGIALDQAKLSVTQAEAQLEAQRQALMIRVATAYFNVLRAQAVVLFRRSELDAIGRQKEQNERRFEVGLVPVTDVKNAQAQFDLATAQEIAAANSLSTAEEALIVISGADPKSLKQLSSDAPLVLPDPVDINAWVKIAEEQNIPLVVAKLAAESAKEQVRLDRAERYPTLDLVGLARRFETEQRTGRDIDSGEVRVELNLPLLTGGRINASVAQSRMEAQAAGQRLTAQRRATVQNTRDSYRSVVADVSRVQALKQALISTQKSLEAQEAGFAEGLLTSLEVLRSLRDTFSAQSDYASARYDYILNSLNLKQAVGILSESDLQTIDNWLVDPPQ
ncbi:MAG: TolC family outer membrane protein [Gammaproteobacteria bacterium]|nr:TolC family outer membrane protein [Gammaproteobacteria bacterium]